MMDYVCKCSCGAELHLTASDDSHSSTRDRAFDALKGWQKQHAKCVTPKFESVVLAEGEFFEALERIAGALGVTNQDIPEQFGNDLVDWYCTEIKRLRDQLEQLREAIRKGR